MRNKWPFVAVAAFVNSLVVTSAFIEFKLNGVTGITPSWSAGDLRTFFSVHPIFFGAIMFVATFLLMVTIIGIANLVTNTTNKLQSLNKSLANTSAIATSFDAL